MCFRSINGHLLNLNLNAGAHQHKTTVRGVFFLIEELETDYFSVFFVEYEIESFLSDELTLA